MDLNFYLSVEDDKIIMASQSVSGGDIIDVEVTEEVYNGWLADNELYIYKDGKIIKNPDYETIKANERKAEFENKFIQTPWGWYRKQPKGYSNAPQSVDILCTMVNVSGGFTQQIADMMIFYKQPDFSKPEECTEEWLIEHQYKHQPCTVQDFMQFYIAFQTAWANDQYKSESPDVV